MSDDPRNRPDPPGQPGRAWSPDPRNRPVESAPATGSEPAARAARSGEQDDLVRPRPKPVLILPARTLPPGAERVSLTGLLDRLRQDRATHARPIGPAPDPEALAATLTEDQIQGLVRELGDRVRVVEDPSIDL